MASSEEDGSIMNEDLSSPDFILRNLKIARDVETDTTCTIEARVQLSDIMYHQTIYYLYTALHCFEVLKECPTILVYGTGYVGNKIISKLMDLGLTYYLRIFSRGDEGANFWKSRGLQASSSLPKIIKSKADIVIVTSPLSSFPAISKHLNSVVDETTFIISTSFGLQRKRIYCNLNFPAVMRAFTEAEHVTRRLKALFKKQELDELQRQKDEERAAQGVTAQMVEITPPSPPHPDPDVDEDPNGASTPIVSKPATPALPHISSSKPGTPGQVNAEGLINTSSAGQQGDAAVEYEYEDVPAEEMGNADDYNLDNLLDDLKLANLNALDYAADLVAVRVNDIRLLLYVFENFYALKGMMHPQARYEALRAGLGYEDSEYYPYELDKETEREMVLSRHAELTRGVHVPVVEKDFEPGVEMLARIMKQLKLEVINGFHRHLSKHIKVVDLPKVSTIIRKLQRLKELNPEVVDTMHKSIIDKYAPKEVDEESVDSELLPYLPGNAPPTVGVDLAFQPMHSHETMQKIYDQDRKYRTSKHVNNTTSEMMDDGDGESLQSDVSLIIEEDL